MSLNDCSSCVTVPERKDRPHTFICHAPSRCGACGEPVEARVVLRGDDAVALKFHPGCGQSEERLGAGREWMAAFLARGEAAIASKHEASFKQTTSTCPECLALVPADVVIREGRVYFKKTCRTCGPSEALVSENAGHYVSAYSYARAGTEPLQFAADVKRGCPDDCGTCGDHEQHTCLPIVEVTDHCNLECPVCIVDNHHASHMPVSTFERIVAQMVAREGMMESIALSGGEPTSHPEILELIRVATRPEIGRVVVITNGLRMGRDWDFARALKQAGCYVSLQLDGFDAASHEKIRGKDLCADKEAALRVLKELRIPTQLIFVAARGVNEDQIGRVVDLFLSEPHLVSLNFQPVSYSGQGGGRLPHDPLDRITIPGVIRRIAEQSKGFFKESDFAPLPCSHPLCVSLSYLLTLDDGTHIPFARFVDFRRHGTLLRSSATLGASPEIHEALNDVIHDVFARQDEIERGPDILKALRRVLDVMFPERPVSPAEAVRLGEGQAKSIFMHHYMDRHDFDLERLRKCCHHYPQVDGRVMPACGMNLFHRGAAKGEGTPIASFGKKPWTEDPPRNARLTVLR